MHDADRKETLQNDPKHIMIALFALPKHGLNLKIFIELRALL